ncbi:MAG: glycosyltransferase family 1 protein [Chthoniobacterales bacterium]
MRIAIDFSTLDHLKMTAGHYRYVVQLVRGLSEIAPDQEFLLLGSNPEPVPELREVFQPGSRWRYRRLRHWKHRGMPLVDEISYLRHFLAQSISLLHVVHDFVPYATRCPVVVTQHDLIEEILPEYRATREDMLYQLHRKRVERRAARVICISQTTANDLDRFWNVPAERRVVIRHGVEEEFFADPGDDLLRDDPLYQPGRLVLVSPFNLEPRKNVAALLAAVQILRQDFPDVRLVLFGRGLVTPEREQKFEKQVEELGLRDTVVRSGVISDRMLRQLYRRADIFVFPSLYEGFGLPLLEALASGACVLAGSTPALAEVAGKAATLVDPTEPERLAAALADLLRDPARRESLRRAGPPRAREFPVARMARETWQTYQEVLSEGRSRNRLGRTAEAGT